jgi:hypothetical protein
MFLKKDFEKTGFQEDFRIISRYGVIIPQAVGRGMRLYAMSML